MRILVITLVALGLTNVLVTADKPEDYPPPPPVPAAKSVSTTTTTTVKPVVKKIKPSEVPVKSRPRSLKPELGKKKKLAIKKSKKEVPVQAAQRRDSSYGAPSYAPPKRQVIIKPAGPSKQYAWVGHGRYAPLNIPNPFPDDLPKWIPMGNNIFEAGLLYPGKPGSAPASPKKPAPPPPAAPSYSAPVAQPSYSSPQASVDSYSAPEPAPVYNPKPTEAPKVVNLPVEIPAQPAYPSVPSYGQSSLLGQYEPVTAVPAYTTAPPAYTTTQPAYQYQQPTSQYQQPSSQYQQPSSPSKPFTAFGSQAQSSYAPTLPDIGPPGNYPTFNNLPGYSYNEPSYEAQASYESSKSAPVPNTYNAYDVPLKVEETYQQPDDQDVYFIFYEDNQEAPGSPGYVSEAAPPAPTNNQFKPPDNEDIRTIYVPYENAVNVPEVFDVSVGSSFGYSEPSASYSNNPPGLSSYDNPISSFDAPIYDENSYTAAASSYDANTFSDTLYRENAGSLVRKVRKPPVIDDTVEDATSVQFKTSLATSGLPFGSRLSSRNPYNILGL